MLGSTGQLEFVTVAVDHRHGDGRGARGAARTTSSSKGHLQAVHDRRGRQAAPRCQQNPTTGQIVVNVTMDAGGHQDVGRVHHRQAAVIGKQVAIVLDGVVQSAPAVNEPITDGRTAIRGKLHRRDAKQLKTVLETGALPVTLELLESRVVGPTLGQDSLRQGVLAVAHRPGARRALPHRLLPGARR